MTDLPAVQDQQGLAYRHELSVDEVVAQVYKIQAVTQRAMTEGIHYGKIPGTPKPTLLKAGAEKLCLTFRLDPQYTSLEEHDGRHLTVKSVCTLWHIPTGQRMGSGEGSCSTKESKYAYRQARRVCPACGVDAILKSRYPPRNRGQEPPGWWCNPKGGGCGADFSAGDKAIVDQQTGRTENPDLPDQYNTVLKMSNKRSLVAAVLNVTAASDIFTQDMEDFGAAVDDPPAVLHDLHEPQGDAAKDAVAADQVRREAVVLISDGQQKRLRATVRGSGWGASDQEQETALHDILAGHQIAHVKDVPVALFDAILETVKAGPRKK